MDDKDRLNIIELREQAQRHRAKAAQEHDPEKRQLRLALAAEYEKLSAALVDFQARTSSKPAR